MEERTIGEYIERSNNSGDNPNSPSSGLKNCPTAMEAAGGGLPETVWEPQSHKAYIINLKLLSNNEMLNKSSSNIQKKHHLQRASNPYPA